MGHLFRWSEDDQNGFEHDHCDDRIHGRGRMRRNPVHCVFVNGFDFVHCLFLVERVGARGFAAGGRRLICSLAHGAGKGGETPQPCGRAGSDGTQRPFGARLPVTQTAPGTVLAA